MFRKPEGSLPKHFPLSFENNKSDLNNIDSFIGFGDAGDDLSDGGEKSDSENEYGDEVNNNNNVRCSGDLGTLIYDFWNNRKKK